MGTRSLFKEHMGVLVFALKTLDFSLIPITALISYALYLENWPIPTHYLTVVLLAMLLSIPIFDAFKVFQVWRGAGILVEIWRITAAWLLVMGTILAIVFMLKQGHQFARTWMILWTASTLAAILVVHVSVRKFLQYLRERRYDQKGIVLVGAGRHGAAVARHLRDTAWAGLEPIAFLDDSPELRGETVEGIPVIGDLASVHALFRREQFEEIWITLPLRAQDRMEQLLNDVRKLPVSVRFVPDIFGFRLINHAITDFSGLPVVDLSVSPMNGLNRITKRAEDIILGLLFVILSLPAMIAIAIAIKLTSPGPIFYRQERIGRNGKPFTMLKFRTMPTDVESQGVNWGGARSKTVTPIGAFLRRTSLDELPQFFNVLKGDMSIVGPRPERPTFVEQFTHEIPDYMQKHMVKAGITGWAQINGWRGDTDLNKRIEHDLFYIANWSLWLDIRIMFITFLRGFLNKNAY